MDFAILQSGFNLSERGPCKFAVWFESLRRFGSVASLPIESRPCFPRMASQRRGSSSPSSGDPYNSEKAGASCWSPRTWHTDNNFGLRAEDTAHRATPICTTVVQIKRARLENASRTTLPETLFEHTPFLNLKTPRPTTTPPQHHHTHNTTRKRPYVSPSTPTRVWRI